MNKKAVELALNTIIITILALIVLVIIVLIFSGQANNIFNKFDTIIKSLTG